MSERRRTVLVTGVAGGIGRVICSLFNERGWTVFGLDRQDAEAGVCERFIRADLTDAAEINAATETLFASVTHLDALVNNAAYQYCASLQDTPVAEWDRVFAVNVRAPYLLFRSLLPLLQKAGGSVVNVASVHAFATSADIGAYAASKAALAGLTRSAAIEAGPLGVRVNAVAPAAVDTAMLRAGLERNTLSGRSVDEKIRILGGKHPIGRVGRPEEIARAVYFLADRDESSFITGHTLAVDGGALIKLSTE